MSISRSGREEIASIESKRQFLVETFDGKRLPGALTPGPDKKPIVSIAGTSVPLTEVSMVQPFERKFWSRSIRPWTSATA